MSYTKNFDLFHVYILHIKMQLGLQTTGTSLLIFSPSLDLLLPAFMQKSSLCKAKLVQWHHLINRCKVHAYTHTKKVQSKFRLHFAGKKRFHRSNWENILIPQMRLSKRNHWSWTIIQTINVKHILLHLDMSQVFTICSHNEELWCTFLQTW